MRHQTEDTVIINLLKHAVESEGCEITDVDFEKNVLRVNGPDEVVDACARAVAEILE